MISKAHRSQKEGNYMKRLGKFTGKIYEESEVKSMNECGICISDEQAKDEDYIQKMHLNNLLVCCGCFNCPESKC